MEAGVLQVITLTGGGDSADAADVLHHGGQGQRHDGYSGCEQQPGVHIRAAEQAKQSILKLEGQADPGSIQQSLNFGWVHNLHAGDLAQSGHTIGAHHPQKDGDNLYHTLAPDIAYHYNGDGDKGDGPVGTAVGNGGGGEGQSNADDNGAGNNRGKIAHDRLGAEGFEESG